MDGIRPSSFLENPIPMGVLSDRLQAVIDRMQEIDERQAGLTYEFCDSAAKQLEELRQSFEADGDPKAEAIQLLRSEGWILTPPRN